MSQDSRASLTLSTRWKISACAMAAFTAVGFTSSLSVSAQDATPAAGATPEGGMAACVAPDLPPGTPTPMDMASPEAMPGMDMEMASPVAEEEEEYVGTPADAATGDTILAAVQNIANCGNNGDYEHLVALLTTNFLESNFGTGNPYDALANIEGQSFGEFTASNPQTYEDGTVSADVQYFQSQYQLAAETWYLVDVDGTWSLDELALDTPETDVDSAVIGVDLTDTTADDGSAGYAITLAVPSSAEFPGLVFHVNNKSTMDHEFVLLQLPEGATVDGLLDGSVGEEDVAFIGALAPIPAGEQGDMLLLNLPVGVYTAVCFFEDEDGVPHVAKGMSASFEVTAAS